MKAICGAREVLISTLERKESKEGHVRKFELLPHQ